MRMRKGLVGLLVALGLLLPTTVSADQPQDWFISGTRDEGQYLTLDVLIGAIQATLSNDTKIYGNANQLTLNASALAALPFGRVSLGGDLRIVVLSLGMDVGMQSVWRGLQCDPGVECTRRERRFIESGGEFSEDTFAFWEGRAQLALPFNDYALLVGQFSYTISNAPDNYFDYQNTVMRDGDLANLNILAFFKHKDFGGIAPQLQFQRYEVSGIPVSQWNFGFTFITRAGLVRHDDLIVLRLLFNDPDILGNQDVQDSYGAHVWRGPMSVLFAYRSVITL